MTLLDDYDTRYKLRGIHLASEMLQSVPPELLRRTGVAGLLFSVCLLFSFFFPYSSRVSITHSQLKCTHTHTLLRQSLKTTLNFLQNPETPALIRTAIPTLVSLINLTTSPGSAEQFDQLCQILGDAIIGSIWIYATREQDAIEASVDVLPVMLETLGIGSVRYLKVRI